MKMERQVLGDYYHGGYKTGKHHFATVPSVQYIEIDNLKVSFQADSVFINGIEIDNDNFQLLMNIYAGRQQKAKKLTKRVNEIKKAEPKKCIYDAMKLARRQLNIK